MLTEIGFLAAGRGDIPKAEAIFGALRSLRPQRAFAYVGLAVAYLNADRQEEAAQLLWQSLAQVDDPGERADIEAFRGLALQLAGRHSESIKALESAGPHMIALSMLGAVAAGGAGVERGVIQRKQGGANGNHG